MVAGKPVGANQFAPAQVALYTLRRRMKTDDFNITVVGDPGGTLYQFSGDFYLVKDARYGKEQVSHTVIDFDEDGINDVTGKRYRPRKSEQRFIDENGDGINDGITAGDTQKSSDRGHAVGMDRFVDEDGDGINDGRGFFRGEREELREKKRRESDRGMERRRNR